jgi:hypothetical protein
MSETTNQDHLTDIRIAIKDAVERHEDVCVAEVVTAASRRCGCREADVKDQLDALERNGFVYLVGDGADAEVRTP